MLVLVFILFHGEENFFENFNNAYERHYHEAFLCAQLEPFKPSWSWNPSNYEVYEEEVPLCSYWVSIQSQLCRKYASEFSVGVYV